MGPKHKASGGPGRHKGHHHHNAVEEVEESLQAVVYSKSPFIMTWIFTEY